MREIYERDYDTLNVTRPLPRLSFEVVTPPPPQSLSNLLGGLFFVSSATVIAVYFSRILGFWLLGFFVFGLVSATIADPRRKPDQKPVIIPIAFYVVGVIYTVLFAAHQQPSDAIKSAYSFTAFLAIGVGLLLAVLAYLKKYPTVIVTLLAASGFLAAAFVQAMSSFPKNAATACAIYFPFSLLLLLWLADQIILYKLRMAIAATGATRLEDSPLNVFLLTRNRLCYPAFRRGMQFAAFLFAVGFLLIWLLPKITQVTPLATTNAILILIVLSILTAAVHLLSSHETQSRGVSGTLIVVLNALASWSFHSPHPTAHGVYRPPWPWRLWQTRFIALAAVFALSVACFTVSASFFPVTLRNSRPWLALVVNTKHSSVVNSQLPALPHDKQELVRYLNESPEAWTKLASLGLIQGKPFFGYTVFLAIFLSVFVTPLLFFSLIAILTGPLLCRISDVWERASDEAKGTTWDTRIKLIQSSPVPEERNSLLVGYHASEDYPILVPRGTLEEHAHILGDSGSGKTALGLMPLATQLIRFAGRDQYDPDSFSSSVVIMDLKGDYALFQTALQEARAANLPFRWFTMENDRSTHIFNPFLQRHVRHLSTGQLTEILTEGLSLAHGEGFGRSFFTAVNQEVLNSILDAHAGRIQSFRQLYEFTTEKNVDLLGKKLGIKKKKQEDASHLFAELRRLGSIEALNAVPASGVPREVFNHRIDMADVVQRPQVIYFFLPAGLAGTSVRQIGKLALQSLLSAALTRRREFEQQGIQVSADELHRVYLIIDEFQQLVSENLEIFFRQARSMRIATILANQTISDLKSETADLIPTVMANTRFKQYFSSTDLAQQQALIDASGALIDHARSWQDTVNKHGAPPNTFTVREEVASRLTRNDIIEASDRPDICIAHLPRGADYAQFQGYPFLMRTEFHLSKDEYLFREAASWPKQEDSPGTIISSPQFPEPAAANREENKTKPPPVQQPIKPTSGTVFATVFDKIVAQQNERQAREQSRGKKNTRKESE